MKKERVLVTAGAGHQGKLLIPKLAQSGFIVRAVRQQAGKENELRTLGAHEVFVGDLGDQDAYHEAVNDVDVIYHIGPGGVGNEVEMGINMLNAAERAGVRHVVMSSIYHSMINIAQHRYKRDIEEKIIESGLNFTILKFHDYMMPEVYVEPVLDGHDYPIFWPVKEGRLQSFVDLHDMTDAARKVIVEGSAHYHASYELCGPDKLTNQDLVHMLSRLVGREVRVVQKETEDLFKVLWPDYGESDKYQDEISVIKSIGAWYGQYDYVGNPNVLTWLLGRPPTNFEQFVRRTIAERNARPAV